MLADLMFMLFQSFITLTIDGKWRMFVKHESPIVFTETPPTCDEIAFGGPPVIQEFIVMLLVPVSSGMMMFDGII